MEEVSGHPQRLVPHHSVVELAHTHGIVLFHLAEDRVLALNQIAAAVWKDVREGVSLEEIFARWRRSAPPVSEAQVCRDIDTLLAYLQRSRCLVCAEGEAHLLPRRRSPLACWLLRRRWWACSSRWGLLACEAYWTQRLVNSLLRSRTDGLLVQARMVTQMPTLRTIAAADPLVRRLCEALKDTARLLPFRSRCLQQSLALCWLLARRRIEADVVIGAYTHPLSLHAWVESGGEVIQWEAGIEAAPDPTRLAAMSVLFHSQRDLRRKGAAR
jgi:hypothetical protein